MSAIVRFQRVPPLVPGLVLSRCHRAPEPGRSCGQSVTPLTTLTAATVRYSTRTRPGILLGSHRLPYATGRESALTDWLVETMSPNTDAAKPQQLPQPQQQRKAYNPQAGKLPVVEPERYEDQLQAKLTQVKDTFSKFGVPEPQVHRSAPKNYRNRAEFRVWHDYEEGVCYYIMFEKNPETQEMMRVRMDDYPVGTLLVNELMKGVFDEVNKDEELKHKLYQVNFHTTQSGDAMVTMIYHKELKEPWTEAASALRRKLKAVCPSLKAELPRLIGRSRKQKVELDCSHVTETMDVGGRILQYMQVEGAFSQPNGGMCQQMLGWAHSVTLGSSGDLVELYCGNGNFTLALASNFKQVLGTEISKTSVAVAKHNIAANSIDNVMVGRLSAEEFVEAWKEGTKLTRLDEKDLRECYDFTTVLVDPPRAGLDDSTEKMVTEFDNIVYISCNPATLAENLETLCKTHRVEKFAVFDQFPYTHHLECGVFLTRKAAKRKPEDDGIESEREGEPAGADGS